MDTHSALSFIGNLRNHDELVREFQERLAIIPDKKQRVEETIYMITVYGDSYADRFIKMLGEVKETSRQCGFEVGEIICNLNLAFFEAVARGLSPENILSSPEFPGMLEKLKTDEKWYPFGLHTIAFMHWFNGAYEDAFSVIFDAIRFTESREFFAGGWLHFALGVFYFDTKDFESSRKSYQKAFEVFNTSADPYREYGMARASNGLGTIAVLHNRLEEAEPRLGYAAAIYAKLSHYAGLSRALNDLAMLEKRRKNYNEAIALLNEAVRLRQEINHQQGLITSHTELGEINLLLDNLPQALDHFNTGLELAFQARSRQKQARLCKLLYDTFKRQGNNELALLHFERFYSINTELLGDEAANKLKRIQSQYERERSEQETEIEKRKNAELEKAYAIIKEKNSEIEDQRRDILASITYARRIQYSVLPRTELITGAIPNSFIYYKPKDIVSGDFYWFHEPEQGSFIIVCGDCTGHGVPGAMMTVIGSNLLQQIVVGQRIHHTPEILSRLDSLINQTLKQYAEHEHFVQDGMDLSMLKVNRQTTEISFCSARRPGFLLRNGELHELMGDKHALGGMVMGEKTFTETRMKYFPDDVIYLFTDGCTDQFGGDSNKKFSTRRLKETLLNVHRLPMEEQKTQIGQVLETWRGNREQTDDILMLGIGF